MTDLDETLDSIYWGDLSRSETKQAILDWHNKQIEEVLDRLSGQAVTRMAFDQPSVTYVLLSDIEAERNKLKEAEL